MTLPELQRRLDAVLREAGCERYTADQALDDAATCWREIRDDCIAHGGSGEEPFFNFVVADGVGIFALYGTEVDLYVVRGEEWDFRRHFEPLAISEVEAARAILASQFNRPRPDVTVDASSSRTWLASPST